MMIELSTYLWTVGILITIISLFLAHYLRQPRSKSITSVLKKQNDILITKDSESQAIILNLKDKSNEQQEQIAKQSSQLSIFSKYTFDRSMGYLKSRTESKPYCTACILQFKEIELHTNRNPFQCPKCGAEFIKK